MLVGRKEEIKILERALHDDKSHFIALYGRRRIGKTFLIREFFGNRFTFQHSGLSGGSYKNQLFAFESSLKEKGYVSTAVPHNWLEAFEGLKELIRQSKEERKIIFIDELSWMDTPKCDLMMALENFWNGWASARDDIVLIVCASATSWIMSKVIHNKGGLYNRLTDQINLKPFRLKECEELIRANNLTLNREQILQAYMIFGGVPYYWCQLEKGKSLAQNIDNLFFSDDAKLKDEYKYLYASIFKNPGKHIKIIEALSKKKIGMTRTEIIETTGLQNSGDLSIKLGELESCGFIRQYYAYGMKKRNAVYQLTDCFTLFYFQFMRDGKYGTNFWASRINTPSINTWQGLAFERVCMLHIDQIKEKLGIQGVQTSVNSWYCKEDENNGIHGSQIDLLIVRDDKIINLCEMKYSAAEYTINKETAMDLRRKISDFTLSVKPKYAIYPTLITVYGLVENMYSDDIQSVIVLDDLFR